MTWLPGTSWFWLLTVPHYDSDFDLIAAVTGQSFRMMVPAGLVD
ncbi:MAG TPA: hypothetical protein VGP18_01275 [Solirubrobacteraceae bacterium]|nr:hypothetical protein [Solirubrobacteraceae bacterium]